MPLPCVLDASAAIKIFLSEDYSEDIQRLFEQAKEDSTNPIHVPDLFFIECANVLWKKVRRGEYPETSASENLADLRALDLPTTPTSELMERALRIACLHGITAYDACYVALAEQLDVPLLTADSRLAGLLSNAGFKTVPLGD
ncbi:MAG: type II toxin-antitoxin system VapC family toxin [Armatimonadetes bacterium]|nr:type II toxin-antitoxin system VapC family toxin [Armatimonadota bacterium]